MQITWYLNPWHPTWLVAATSVNNILVRDLSALPGIIIEKVDIPSSTLPSNEPAISADGRYVSFHSDEAYTADDSYSVSDVFRAHNSTLP